jgi:hypothetical protein
MENQFISITKHDCPSCGSSLKLIEGIDIIECEFCNTKVNILRPVSIDRNKLLLEISDLERSKFDNLLILLENALIAGNYNEAYEYCGKALELNPKSSMLWENKAICTFWLCNEIDVFKTKGREIKTYLSKAKELNESSELLTENSKNIASSLFLVGEKWWKLFFSEKIEVIMMNSDSLYEIIVLYKTCFEIYPEPKYLKVAIEKLSYMWWKAPSLQEKYRPLEMKDNLIKQLQVIDCNYTPPQKKGCFIATAAVGSYYHPEVMELRKFRDNWILKKQWGESFVKWYYHYGAIAAKFIEKSFVLKKLSYLLIVKPLVYLSRIVK